MPPAEIIMAGLAALGIPAGLYATASAKRRRRERWQAAAKAAGLDDVVAASGFWVKGLLTARAGPFPVRVEEYSYSRDNHGTRVVIVGGSGLTLRAEKDVSAVQRVMGPREIELGDAEFDREVYVEGGEPPMLRAVLDVETRGMVRRFLDGLVRSLGGGGGLVAHRAAVYDGSVTFEVASALEDELLANFTNIIMGPLELARRLERPPSIVRRLVENTAAEPNPRMRLENLKLLARTFPHHPGARELLAQGCDDEKQEIQLQCALALGPDDARGHATLTDIATRGWSDDSLAARAIVALGAKLPLEKATATLNQALRVRSPETARACLQALGESGSADVVDTLAKVLGVEKGELAVAAARALGACGQPAAEAPLVKALRARSWDVRTTAAEALAAVGTAAAVQPLKEAAERDGDLRRTVRQAIAAIHERLGATPGQVSLAGSEAGTLTLTDEDDAAGRLSMNKRAPS